MMSKKKFFVVLTIFILYLLLGAGIFQIIESNEEDERVRKEVEDRAMINHYLNESHVHLNNKLINLLENYCDKPIRMVEKEPKRLWDFYHSLFFVITVVSTIGYGNLAPTTMFTRIFMIFYGLIGIPMNGIVMVTMGTYFGRSFTKLYQRWKRNKQEYDMTRLGLISQIILYLVPGFAFFIFVPSGFMVLLENWDYHLAVYYCFVTLTTIGFGDYVAGVDNVNEFTTVSYWIYKMFLLVWVIGGLGYIVMILGFITQALQSNKMREIEHIIKTNIKKTPVRIRQELRTLLQEFLFLKVKPVYKEELVYCPPRLTRSHSWPTLKTENNLNPCLNKRKRALSECPHTLVFETENTEHAQQSELLQKVVDALSIIDGDYGIENSGYDGFSDSQILASEQFGSRWSLKSQSISSEKKFPIRRRAISDIRNPSMRRAEASQDISWFSRNGSERHRTLSEPTSELGKTPNFLTRMKNRFLPSKEEKDVEQNPRRTSASEDRYLKQTNRGRVSVLSIEQEAVLEQTSIADFIRALTAITVPESMLQNNSAPKRKMGTAGITPPNNNSPQRTRRLAIRPMIQARRTSLMPDTNIIANERRRYSLRPVEENLLAPPPYSANPFGESRTGRKFSKLLNVPSVNIGPVQRQVNKRDTKDDT